MNANGMSDAQFAAMKSSLAKSVGKDAAVRLRTVLVNEQVVDESNVDAIRSVLSTWESDRKLRELVANDGAWDNTVAAVFEYREMLKSEFGRTRLLVIKAAGLIVGVAEDRHEDVVGLG